MATSINPPRDPNTLSNYNNWICTHITANFDILFDQKKLVGNVIHKLKSTTNGDSKEIILDSNHVTIGDVKIDGKPSDWELLPPLEPYGSALKIKLDQGVNLDETIDVEDTPDVKSTIDFNISSPLPVIASGLPVRDGLGVSKSEGRSLYQFHQRVPIPSYLFALASGDISEAPIGPRSVVATSPDKVQECQWELEADTEKFIGAIEKIVYPYAWGEYNVLILPPSFPYGGMENPIFTFATPSIISKDRENIDVIAHELAHSWSGNLVTNASWEHFWLNEGWTTYLERRAYRHFSAIIGWKALADSVEHFGHDHEFTKLITDLKGKDPDDSFSSIPYEKGFNFLFHLETLVGKQKFDRFIPHYFTVFKGKSLDSYEFKATLLDFFDADAEASKLLNDLDWDTWFYAPGLPPKPQFDTSLVDVVYELAQKWKSLPETSFKPQPSDIENLSANQIVVFLEQMLLLEQPLTPELSKLMGEVYGLSKSENIEVANLYFQVGLKAGDESVVDPATELLGRIGRMKFVRPL
ncbi:leukotriene A-4 hydrolase [Aspergillus luchuensis]|uniref:Leukotriene A-4 hydrolase n=1 Tax=Aspergillus kawachii TaxID=1069201 RepID=A0A146G0I5_ASPKA|nr:leukotriene A-4 hydrolase [Aspergillus luchuensis]